MGLKANFIKVVSANAVSLLLSITTGFLIPDFLSIDQYAFLKTFTLYLSFVGIMHFGFIDGMHIKYGGLDIGAINFGTLKGEHKVLFILQIVVSICIFVVGILIKDYILIAFSFIIIPINMITMFKTFYQSIGEFNQYSKIVVVVPILTLFMRLFNIYVIGIDTYWTFVVGNIVINYVIFLILEIDYYRNNQQYKLNITQTEINNNFKIGIFILIGNLAYNFLYSIDSWFVKILFSVEDFAYYSFAVSILKTINIVINSITLIFYPYLAKNKKEINMINDISIWLLFIGTLLSGTYFIFSFIVSTYLEKYIVALNVIAILFLGYPAVIIIRSIYVNMYKAKKEEKKYVKIIIEFLLISVILNIIALLIYKNIISVAIATTLSFYIWFFSSNIGFKIACCNNKSKIYLLVFIIVFSVSVYYLNWWIGLIVFYMSMISIIYIFYKKESNAFIQFLLKNKMINKGNTYEHS